MLFVCSAVPAVPVGRFLPHAAARRRVMREKKSTRNEPQVIVAGFHKHTAENTGASRSLMSQAAPTQTSKREGSIAVSTYPSRVVKVSET